MGAKAEQEPADIGGDQDHRDRERKVLAQMIVDVLDRLAELTFSEPTAIRGDWQTLCGVVANEVHHER